MIDSNSASTWRVESEASLATMSAEWASIQAGRVSRKLRNNARKAARWESALLEMQAEQRALREAGRWVGGPYDLLSIISYARNELVHSAAVSWLLDPGMRHGLGTRVLEFVLEHCFPDDHFSDLALANVYTEVTREQSRIDILVEAPGLTLIIENKVDALESSGQCDTYFRLFGDEPGARFVFLSPQGRAPTTATGPAAEAFVPVSYRAIADALRRALDETSAERHAPARAAAEAYLVTLERRLS
jgi:hypothetical protein